MKLADFVRTNQLLCTLFILHFLIYIDRGVIPGCTLAVNTFIQTALQTTEPSFYTAIIQSSFIVGLSVASIFFAHASRNCSIRLLLTGSMLIWVVAALLVGVAPYLGKAAFPFLLSGRILSGVSEGSLIALIPPLILTSSTGAATGYWMGMFAAVLPLGVAIGFLLGGVVSQLLGWNFSFLILAFVMAMIIGLLQFYPASITPPGDSLFQAPETPTPSELDYAPGSSLHPPHRALCQKYTGVWNDLKTILLLPEFLCISVANASYSACVMAFSTFGSAFLQGLGFNNNEMTASMTMSVLVVVTGCVGGFAGGFLSSFSTQPKRIPVADATQSFVAGADTHQTLDQHHTSSESDFQQHIDYPQLFKLLSHLIPLTLLGCVCLTAISIIDNRVIFMATLGIALTLIFACQSNLNLSVMGIVPARFKSLSIATTTLFLHLFGDVLGTPIIGLIKDTLAPHCNVLDPETNAVYPECLLESRGIRMTVFIIGIWLVWMVLGVLFAYLQVRRNARKGQSVRPFELVATASMQQA